MALNRALLFTPGPTPIPERVLLKMAAPIIHHRTKEFEGIFAKAVENLKWLMQTKEDVLIFASSGTGAMESAIVNTCSPGDKVLVIRGGKFGERWGKLAQAYGLDAKIIDVEWGQAVKAADVKAALDADPAIRAVFLQASETSTGVSMPVKEIAALTRQRDNTIIVVDGITAVGVDNIPMDEWGLDVVITGSQKALMLPPGLAFVGISQKAFKFCEQAKLPRFYFDWREERKAVKKNTTAWTPAVTLIIGLNEALQMMREETLEGVFKRHATLAEGTRRAVKAINLGLLAPDSPANSVTAVKTNALDGEKVIKTLNQRFGITVAEGQDHLKGKIFRVSHIGYFTSADMLQLMACLESCLTTLGHSFSRGAGVSAMEAYFREQGY